MQKPAFWPDFLGAIPYIIAEVGSNWVTKEDCLESIRVAAKCGASAVKFQYFTHEDLYGEPRAPGRQELPKAWLPELAAECKAHAVDFLCTVFNPDKVQDVDPFVRMHKVASSEASYPALLEALRKTGKPVILSTGGHMLPEIGRSLDMLGHSEVCLMYCVAAYPAQNVNLFKIDALRNAYPMCGVGYSDHTTDVYYYPRAAARLHGALIIEKHFTIFATPGLPDHEHALKWRKTETEHQHEFRIMTDYIRGPGFIPPSEDMRPDEEDMRKYHRRRQTERGFFRLVPPV